MSAPWEGLTYLALCCLLTVVLLSFASGKVRGGGDKGTMVTPVRSLFSFTLFSHLFSLKGCLT